MKRNWSILALLSLSLALHLIKLGHNPTFIADEASIGYNAYSILKTGRDEWEKLLPLTFKAFGEYKLPLYIYISVLPVKIFGLGKFSTRFTSAFFGALSTIFVFLIIKKLFPTKDKRTVMPWLVSFLFIINPWHVQTSRLALEANLALFLFLWGFYLFIQKKLTSAFFFFGLTFYAYNAFRLFIPFFLILAWFFEKKTFKQARKAILVFFLMICPLVLSGFKGSGERLYKTSIFADPGMISRIEQKRVSCLTHLDSAFCRLVFNRPVVYASEIFKNYWSHLSPHFLFTKGAGLAQYSLPNFGMVYILEAPLLVFGFYQLIKDGFLKARFLPWLIAAPAATSLTGAAHPVRSLILMPLLPIFSGMGIYFLFNKLNRARAFLILVVFLGISGLVYFSYQYFYIYPTQTGSIWQQAYEPLYHYLEEIEESFGQIRISKFYGEPHVFYLFYRQFEPKKYQQNQEIVRYDREDRWVNVDQIGKYYFFEKLDLENPGLVVLAVFDSQPDLIPQEEIFYRNGEIAFKIYEIE